MPRLQQTLDVLKIALELKKGDEEKAAYLATKDNTVASFGKIIKGCQEVMPIDQTKQLVSFWVSHLPLVKDKEEGVPQHDMLCDIIIHNPNMVLGENYENIEHVIRIFIKIYKKSSSNVLIDTKINAIMTKLTKDPIVVSAIHNINFNQTEKEKIDQLLLAPKV